MPAFKKLRKYSRYVVSSDEAEEEQREQQPKTKLMECDSSQTQSQNEVLDLSLREKVVVREEMPTLTVEEILVRMDNEELAEEKGKEMEKEKVMEKETCVEKEREYQEGQETQEMVFTSESEAELNEAMDAFEEETKKKKEMVLQEIDVSGNYEEKCVKLMRYIHSLYPSLLKSVSFEQMF